jgi:hypothetical protein
MSQPTEYDNFVALTDRLLSIPKKEILRREVEYKQKAASNLNRRGPKRKDNKPSASPAPAAS